jgi:biopolymer transport protein ExbD
MITVRALYPVLLSSVLSSGCGPTGDHKLTAVDLRVSSSGECTIGNDRLNCGVVGAYIVQHYDSDEVDVRLRVDRNVKYDEMAKVLASLQSSHIVRVGFVNYKHGT